MKLAICLPSRGLIHSRTFEAVWMNVKYAQFALVDLEIDLFFSHDNNIPDCFNVISEEAIAWGADMVWFVEEDMVPHRLGLVELLLAEGDVRAHDYLIDYNGQPVTKYKDGEPIFTGMGSMLVPVAVLEKTLPFTTKYSYDIVDGEYILRDWDPGYGGQDVYFCMQLRDLGFSLNIVGQAQHLRVRQQGRTDSNNGAHDIEPIQKA